MGKSSVLQIIFYLFTMSMPFHAHGHVQFNSKQLKTFQKKYSKVRRGIASETIVKGPDMNSTKKSIVEFSDSLTSGIECRSVSDIQGTIFCMAKTEKQLRSLMGRVSYFVEGLSGAIVAEDDSAYVNSEQAVYAGHDIKLSDFMKYYLRTDQECKPEDEAKRKYCLNQAEQELKERVLDESKKYADVAVIAVQANTRILLPVATHELMHARYFLNPEYKKVVRKFWYNNVTEIDRKKIAEVLSGIYPVIDYSKITEEYVANIELPTQAEILLLNEFQAYLLMEDKELYSQLTAYFSYSTDLAKSLKSYIQ